MEPQLGEIWHHNDNGRYFLITDKYEDRSWITDSAPMMKWSFIHLNDGLRDAAYIEFFNYHCQKVA